MVSVLRASGTKGIVLPLRSLRGQPKVAEKAGFMLLRAHKGLPKNKALIKLISEEGNKTLLQKTENTYMQENSKRMPEVTEELLFIIEEKQHSIELTDKGIDLISTTDDPNFFVLPDIGSCNLKFLPSIMSPYCEASIDTRTTSS